MITTLGLPRKVTPRPPRRTRVGAFAGASYGRLTEDFVGSLLSADQLIKCSLRRLRARSRQLIRDNPHAVAFVNLVADNVIGPRGIRLQSRIREGRSRKELRELNAAIEDAWIEWGAPETASADGHLAWEELQAFALMTVAGDGEFLARRRRGYRNRFGYTLQVLDADQLDETYNVLPSPGQNEIRMGVEIDADGRALAYHLWDGHPNDPGVRGRGRIRVPADQIVHCFLKLYPGQTRGIPWLTPVMLRLGMLDGYEEAELVAAREAASNPIFFETGDEAADITREDEDADKPLRLDVEPGMAIQLPKGLKAVRPTAEHPTSAYAPFTKAALRAIAAGLRVSYAALTGDLEAVNYSSMRAGLLQERDGWRRLQQWATRHLCTPVYKDWLLMATMTGAVRLPSMDVARWTRPVWQPRGWAWVDPLNDAMAAKLFRAMGLTNNSILAGELGLDFEEIIAQRAEELALAEYYGVDISGEDAPPEAAPARGRDASDVDDEDLDERPSEGDEDEEDEDEDEEQPARRKRARGAPQRGRLRAVVRLVREA